ATTGAPSWFTAANWNPAHVPTNLEIAIFDTAGTHNQIGINFNSSATNNGTLNQIVGEIMMSATSVSRSIGNSTTTSGKHGTLTLAGVSGTLLSNQHATNSLTLADNAGSGTQGMDVALGVSGNIAVPNAGASVVLNGTRVTGIASVTLTGAGSLSLSGNNTFVDGL